MLVASIRALKDERVEALEMRRGRVASLGGNGVGLGALTIAGTVFVSRRKRGEPADRSDAPKTFHQLSPAP